jgi:hypothetical protein
MQIGIVKRVNKNVDLIDTTTGFIYISMSPDIADVRVVNQEIKITQRNGNVESINYNDVVDMTIEPSLPSPPPANVYDLLAELSRNYFYCCSASSTPIPTAMKYGSFYDTTIQDTPSGVNVPMQYNSTLTADTNGVSIINDSLARPNIIRFTSNGTYNIQFSAQVFRTAGTTDANVFIFARYIDSIFTVTPIPNTNTRITLRQAQKYLVASWNLFVNISDYNNQQLQLCWYHDENIELTYEASTIVGQPDVPSVILTVNQIA